MYIRNTLTYTPTTDPNTNKTTKPPEMSEWKIDTSLIGEILLATFMIATSAAATILGQREVQGGFWSKFGELYGYKSPSGKTPQSEQIQVKWYDAVLAVASYMLFIINPNLMDAIVLLIGAFGIFFNFIVELMNSRMMRLYTIMLLSLIILLYAKKIITYPGDKLELIKKDINETIERVKKLFLLNIIFKE